MHLVGVTMRNRLMTRYGANWSDARTLIAVVCVGFLGALAATRAPLISTATAQSSPAIGPNAGQPTSAANRVVIKFATTGDFPPFNARDEDGVLVGFNVDLARALCLELDVTCEVSAKPWDGLFPALNTGEADAIIAAHRVNVETVAKADFTQPYFHTPGRFAVRRDGPALTITPSGLDRKRVGVAKGTAHEAFIQTFFRTSRIVRFDTPEQARRALQEKKLDLIFEDGISLVFWINGSLSAGCCDLAGGAYLEPLFFGDGIAIAVKKGNRSLRTDLDTALEALRANGRMVELIQRYFPRRIY